MIEKLCDIGVDAEDRTGRATALPARAQDVAAVVGLARAEGWLVAPHWWKAPTAARPVVFVSPERMSAVDEVAREDLMATVGAGVTVSQLSERTGKDGLCWPVGELAAPDDMVGDVIAKLLGAWTLRGSVGRRYLLAVDAVLADGALLRAGARTMKSVTGYDLRQLLVGSHGTLGIITGLTLRLESLANVEAVLERYRRDFAGRAAASDRAEASRSGPAGDGGDGARVLLERLKRELDPAGVFPAVADAFPEGTSS